MTEATESKFFREQKAKSMNALQNGAAPWTVQPKSLLQMYEVIQRVNMDLEEGILTKLRLQRK